jgi:hypothetical protein
MDEKDMKYERNNRKRKESGIGKDVNFFELLFLCFFCNQESERVEDK